MTANELQPAFVGIELLLILCVIADWMTWWETRKLRRDVLHAGMDIHGALIEQLVIIRLQAMGQPDAKNPTPGAWGAPIVDAGKEAELWLEKQRERMRRK